MKYKIEGMKELQKTIKQIEKVPQKCVTPAAKKGMNIALKEAKSKSPVETGELKKGIKLLGEKSRLKGKKVYRIVFDEAKNDIFQKKNKEGEVTGYYPVSQEYGFFARNGRYIPGYHFIEDGFNNNTNNIEKKIVSEISKQLDKAMR